MQAVRQVLFPSIWLPLRFIGGLGCGLGSRRNRVRDWESESVFEPDEEAFKQPSRKQHYMNYEFEPSFRSIANNELETAVPLGRVPQARASSRRRYMVSPSPSTGEAVEVDVLATPSAFAFHTVPKDGLFCSRDDSEIGVRSPLNDEEESQVFPGIDNDDAHANVAYLYPTHTYDDMEIGMFTEKKTPLRHMGSAIIYRREINGMECSSSLTDPDVSDSNLLPEVYDRNKLVRLESIVGRVHKRANSRTEFGVVDSELYALMNSEMHTPLSEVRPSNSVMLKSHPISNFSKLSEQTSMSDEDWKPEDSAKGIHGRPSSRGRSPSWKDIRCSSSQSMHRFRIASSDLDKNGAINPHYECPDELYPLDSSECLLYQPVYPAKFNVGFETISENKQLAGLPEDARPRVVRSNGTRDFLLNRLLAAGYISDQATQSNDVGSVDVC